jgi:HTH-type transcriptional regulator, competence development regulator
VAQNGEGPSTSPATLGARLRQVRERKELSISVVAKKAGISTAYLQKLEVGDVQHPSPRVLHSLAGVLQIDYAELMRLADYVVPNQENGRRRRNELTHALSSEKLTEEEAEMLAEYLNWYRSRARKRVAK